VVVGAGAGSVVACLPGVVDATAPWRPPEAGITGLAMGAGALRAAGDDSGPPVHDPAHKRPRMEL
jgi:hypothetical protein